MIKDLLPPEWYTLLGGDKYFETEFKKVSSAVGKASKNKAVSPRPKLTMRAFEMCPLDKLEVVILGQDPYPNGEGTGLAFANDPNTLQPSSSLLKIIDCIEDSFDLPIAAKIDLSLESWARQGVLLLNSSLTVEYKKPGSHTAIWRPFTEHVINKLVSYRSGNPLIFVMMGKQAQSFISPDMEFLHDVFRVAHPASEVYNPTNKQFTSSKVFKHINDRLELAEKKPINFNS